MGFVKKQDYLRFLKEVPEFEKMLVDSGIKIIKFYFSVSKENQAERFESRKQDPLKQFKLSPIDQYSQQLWDKYTLAEYKNFSATHSKKAPWVIIKSDDKKTARLNAMKYVLSQYEYEGKINEKSLAVDKDIVTDGKKRAKLLEDEIVPGEKLFD